MCRLAISISTEDRTGYVMLEVLLICKQLKPDVNNTEYIVIYNEGEEIVILTWIVNIHYRIFKTLNSKRLF